VLAAQIRWGGIESRLGALRRGARLAPIDRAWQPGARKGLDDEHARPTPQARRQGLREAVG